MRKNAPWIPLGPGEVDTVSRVGVIIDPDRKFGYATLKIDAVTQCGARVRVFTESARGLRLKTKRAGIADIFKPLIGKPIHFRLFRSPDGENAMYFPIHPTLHELRPLKEAAKNLIFYV